MISEIKDQVERLSKTRDGEIGRSGLSAFVAKVNVFELVQCIYIYIYSIKLN